MSKFDYDGKLNESLHETLKKAAGIELNAWMDYTLAGKIVADYSLFHSYGFRAGVDAAITAILAGEIDLEEVRKARTAHEAKD